MKKDKKLHDIIQRLYYRPDLIDKANAFLDMEERQNKEADRDFKYQVRDELKVILKEIGCK